MRSLWLVFLMVLYALFALFPAIAWFAGTFDSVDDGWRDWLVASVVTWPIALGLAALTLVAHGLLVNARFRADAEEQLDEIEERQRTVIARSEALVPVGGAVSTTTAAGPAATGTDAETATVSAPRGMKTAPIARGEPIGGSKSGGRNGKRGGRGKRYQRRALSMARRQLRRRSGF